MKSNADLSTLRLLYYLFYRLQGGQVQSEWSVAHVDWLWQGTADPIALRTFFYSWLYSLLALSPVLSMLWFPDPPRRLPLRYSNPYHITPLLWSYLASHRIATHQHDHHNLAPSLAFPLPLLYLRIFLYPNNPLSSTFLVLFSSVPLFDRRVLRIWRIQGLHFGGLYGSDPRLGPVQGTLVLNILLHLHH